MLSIGIVGLPNVGKSTLFNALTRSKQADAQNYPFCTIEPNVGVVTVPDDRLLQIADVAKSAKIVPTAIEFVDIAGLVKGASEGEGLGNKFLSHIREVDAIVHVVRGFEDPNVTHVHGIVNPKEDAAVINLELVFADMETVANHTEKTKAKAKGIAAKEYEPKLNLLDRLSAHLSSGSPTRTFEMTDDQLAMIRDLHLLTMKPIMYVINEGENRAHNHVSLEIEPNAMVISVSARLEAELADLSEEDRIEYMRDLCMEQSGLDKMIVAGYQLLNLVTFFTAGPQEARAWTVPSGTVGPNAAGVIHTDFIKRYIKADVAKWEDFVTYGGWNGVKEKGKMQLVGKDYIVSDGDVCYFHVG